MMHIDLDEGCRLIWTALKIERDKTMLVTLAVSFLESFLSALVQGKIKRGGKVSRIIEICKEIAERGEALIND